MQIRALKNIEKINKERIVIMHTLGTEEKLNYVLNYVNDLNRFEDVVVLPTRSYSTAIGGENAIGFAFYSENIIKRIISFYDIIG